VKKKTTWIFIAAVFFAMLYVWPNLIHEPAHYVALKLQGSDGVIHFDWTHYPAQPSTTRTEPVAGIAGGLFFVLAPSLLSLAILTVVMMRKKIGKVSVAIALYVAVDLILNIYTSNGAISDFKFLTVLPYGELITYGAIGIVVVLAAIIALRVGMAVDDGSRDEAHTAYNTTSSNDGILARTRRREGVHNPSSRSMARRNAGVDGLPRRRGRAKEARARISGVPQTSAYYPNASVTEGRAE